MTLDKFGRSSLKSRDKSQKGPKGDGFNLTPDGNYDMQNKRLCKLALPTEPSDAASKSYVEITCENKLEPVSTNLGLLQGDVTGLKTRLVKCEGLITSNKDFHDQQLRKFGTMVFSYINKKQTGRAATSSENDNLNWEELFKIPDKEEEEYEVEIEDDDTVPFPNYLRTEDDLKSLKP